MNKTSNKCMEMMHKIIISFNVVAWAGSPYHQSIQLICVSATTAKSDRMLAGISENPELQRSVSQEHLSFLMLSSLTLTHASTVSVPQPRTMTVSAEVERTLVKYDVRR